MATPSPLCPSLPHPVSPPPPLLTWSAGLLAVHAQAVHVLLALGVVAREGLPVLVHAPAEAPLSAFRGAALGDKEDRAVGIPCATETLSGTGGEPPCGGSNVCTQAFVCMCTHCVHMCVCIVCLHVYAL